MVRIRVSTHPVEKGRVILSEACCSTKKNLEGGLSVAISSILCFDFLPLCRSSH